MSVVDVEALPRSAAGDRPAEAAPRAVRERSVRAWWKPLVSLWLAFHVAAVAIYPATILVPSRGLLARVRDLFFERYMEGLHMVGGHRFFAPEPGPGSLIAYEIERSDGTHVENAFPRRSIRPRLLYHRYFMLSERVQDVGEEGEWFRMYARRLAHEHDAARVTLKRVIHRLPTPEEIMSGKELTDPEFYEHRPIGSWSREELRAPVVLPDEPIEEPAPPEESQP